MRIAIMGAGIAGSWLYRRLNRARSVDTADIYDLPDARLGCSCAFGTEIKEFSYYMKAIGLEPEDYILQHINWLDFQGGLLRCRTDNFCTIDRNKMVEDIVGDNVIRDKADFDEYDYVIDATGPARAFLPPVREDLKVRTRQVRAKPSDGQGRREEDVAYLSFRGIGYEWAFPLGGGEWHIGYGDLEARHGIKTEAKCVCSCKDEVRIIPPVYCQPFVVGKVLGVAEAIGTVSPIAGEGIIPSLKCADILHQALLYNWSFHHFGYGTDLDKIPMMLFYRKAVLTEFKWMVDEYKTIMHFIEGRRRRGILGFLRNFRNGKRFGMKLRARDFNKVIKVIRNWSKTMPGGTDNGERAG